METWQSYSLKRMTAFVTLKWRVTVDIIYTVIQVSNFKIKQSKFKNNIMLNILLEALSVRLLEMIGLGTQFITWLGSVTVICKSLFSLQLELFIVFKSLSIDNDIDKKILGISCFIFIYF